MKRWGLLLAATLCLVHSGLGYETPEELPFGTSFLTPINRAEYTKTLKSDRGRFLKGLYEQADDSKKHGILGEVLPKCYNWWLTEQQRSEIDALHLSGDHAACKKKIHSLLHEQPNEKRENIESYWEFCEHLWYTAHKHGAHEAHRHHENHNHAHQHLRATRHVHTSYEDFAKEHLAWLSDEEKAEVAKLHAENKEKSRAKVMEILEASTGEKKEKGVAALQGACKELIVGALGEEKATELRKMKESGSTNDQIGAKITELLQGVTDEAAKNKALEHKDVCKRIYELKARKRRHVHTSYEDFAKEHLAWLSDEEKAEVAKLHAENKEKSRAKVMEILEASTGEKREKGVAALQGACKELIVQVLGEEKSKELRQMKESGSTNEQIGEKVTELLKGVTDEALKAKALEHKETCAKIYALKTSKKRRSVAHHDLESKLKSEWNWLTDAQKEEIRQLKKDGKSDEQLLSKVFEYFKVADDKSKAEDGLQTTCGGAILTILGVEKAEVLKNFMANGATPDAYEQKVKELLNEAPKKTLTKNQESCKLVFTGASRRRRHEDGTHHHHTLEDYLESSHLSWLTAPQKESVRKLAQEGKSKEVIQKQVLEYYEATAGELKEKATADLQAGCRELFNKLLGPEKSAQLKTLKESGATNEELRKKGDELVEAITDPKAKEDAKFYSVGCRKAFGVESKRKRHTHSIRHRRDHHSLEELFKTYLSWLTEDQQKRLTELKAEGKSREDLQKQVLEYYEAASDSVKENAREKMQDGCRKLLAKVLGTEKANELKQLRESGTPLNDIAEKTTKLISELTDENAKKSAQDYAVVCNKAFNLQ